MEKITDPNKNQVVCQQYQQILDHLTDSQDEHYDSTNWIWNRQLQDDDRFSLSQINRQLWDCENLIRVLTRVQNFGADYVQVSQDIRSWNDERAQIKKKIDQRLASNFWDVKNHIGF